MELDEHLLSIGVIDDVLRQRITDIAAAEKCTFFKAARLTMADDAALVEAACKWMGYRFLASGYGVKIDAKQTEKMGDIFELTEYGFIAVDGQHIFCLLYDPTDERRCRRFLEHFSGEFALCSSKTWDIIYEQSVRPELLAARAKSFVPELGRKTHVEATSTEAQELLDGLLYAGMAQRASDIHIMSLGKESLVRLRVDGVLRDYTRISSAVLPNLRNLLVGRTMVGGDVVNKPIEGQFIFNYGGQSVDTRVNIVNAKLGPDFNLRFIRGELKSLDDIGLSIQNRKKYERLLRLTKGLVIVTGPTGSGKSTLLYAGCRNIANEQTAIFAIEDPVEIVVPQITQINIQAERDYKYADALKSALRHDPDVILIGEIRDKEVAEEAIRAANTGHLVFSTLHTNDALGGLTRMINIGIDPYSLGDCLAAVVAQRLVRRICPYCKETYSLKQHVWRDRYNLGSKPVTLSKGRGCEECAGTGYLGRIAINEILIITPELSKAIQERQTKTDMQNLIKAQGFISFLEDGREKALAGITTLEELDPFNNDIL